MEERQLGKSGLKVSIVGLGCNNFGLRGTFSRKEPIDIDTTRSVLFKAFDLGVTLIDTADSYGMRGGSEEVIGEILGPRRKDVVLATKFGMAMDDVGKLRGGSRRYVISAVEASLKRLKTDWIDLYQLHTPDSSTPIEETVSALDQLIRDGKIRYAGLSNFAAWQLVEVAFVARELGVNGIVSTQEEYNLFARGLENEVMPVMEKYGFGLLPYYPLASGLLTGKYRKDAFPEVSRLAISERAAARQHLDQRWTALAKLEAFSKRSGRSMLDIAFGWLASRKVIGSIIAGATRPDQIEQNVKAAETRLTPSELAELDEITAEFRRSQ